MSEIKNLEPKIVWNHFYEITKIPRESKKEEKIREYLVNWGKNAGLETVVDEIGNVLIRKPATKGYENKPIIILQSHMDMVCEKNSDIDFNFDTDAINTYIEDGWVKAKGTTLGADDGIGIASELAILEAKDLQHGPLECLFTVDEETGLTGAFELKPDFLKGRTLINLDSEDEGEIFIGCAGGKDTIAYLDLAWEDAASGTKAYKIKVSGLRGGHSGDDINKGYGNAVKILNRFIWEHQSCCKPRIADIKAGDKRNAIAREGFATIVIDAKHADAFEKSIKTFDSIIKNEYKITEPNLLVSCEQAEMPKKVFTEAVQSQLINVLYACPHGVISYSQSIPGFVETSTNLAAIKLENNKAFITTSQRSSVESAKDDICNMVASTFELAGCDWKHTDGYPGWEPNPDSDILVVASESYKRLFTKEPVVRAIHAGLECGLIGEKYPGMDMISFGPTLRGVHSPDEKIDIKTVEMFWDHLVDVLKSI